MSFLRTVTATVVGEEIARRRHGSGLVGFGLGFIATRIATRSLPGALLVGGALIAKKLYDDAKEDEAIAASEMVIEIEGQPVPDVQTPPTP
jgi:hypothetical protein|tara:strand:+ start:1260 stop:1532 length:273 start_codon:yes stop_codon:yes gene_type:complete